MGCACVVVSGIGAGGWISCFGSLLAPFPCAALSLWHTDYCAVFLGYGRTAPIRLCRKSSYWRMVVVICDATGLGADSGAYLFGKLFGKHKLAPKVSPGKTWEGFAGGLLTSALIAWLFGRYAPLDVVPSTLLICSVVAALASVLGDLTESMFKREAGIKDSGHMIPGHGGILDRIDSLTAAVPVFACLMLLVY